MSNDDSDNDELEGNAGQPSPSGKHDKRGSPAKDDCNPGLSKPPLAEAFVADSSELGGDSGADSIGESISKTTPAGTALLQFPYSRVPPVSTPGGFRNLGVTALVRSLKLSEEQTSGHWCSRCAGIWFGMPLETQCPVCGNRHG